MRVGNSGEVRTVVLAFEPTERVKAPKLLKGMN
jgi:hypothetical protein